MEPTALIEVILYSKFAKDHAFMNSKKTMDVCLGSSFYVTVANFGKVEVHLLKHQNVGEVTNASVELLHIKDER